MRRLAFLPLPIALFVGACALWPNGIAAQQAPTRVAPLRALIVGGGPEPDYNQVAIESNVRYVRALLPSKTPHITLFADGNTRSKTVLTDSAPDAFADAKFPGSSQAGRRTFELVFYNAGGQSETVLRAPRLNGALDGASKHADIERAFTRLARDSAREGTTQGATPRRALLYFTGHGGSDEDKNENNHYALWGEDGLTVRELAKQIARLPSNVPVTIVMVQCYSGSFGNLLFAGGEAKGAPVSREIAGFFASTKDRTAAGCTSEVNEAEYHDFTSYFFAALCGRDRVGRRVAGVDYNRDGRVGMNEAFAYTLSRDTSTDVPTCTSDVFLRRFAPQDDATVFATPYSQLREWASPAQRSALDSLSSQLQANGENRLQAVAETLQTSARDEGDETGSDVKPEVRASYARFLKLQAQGRQSLLSRFPDLKLKSSDHASKRLAAQKSAVLWLSNQAEQAPWKEMRENADTLDRAYSSSAPGSEELEARRLRFVRLGKSIVLAQGLQNGTDAALKARFARLLIAEGRTILPPVQNFKPAR